jgi:hypothetical protein
VDIANMIIVVTIFVESENISLRLHLLRRWIGQAYLLRTL